MENEHIGQYADIVATNRGYTEGDKSLLQNFLDSNVDITDSFKAKAIEEGWASNSMLENLDALPNAKSYVLSKYFDHIKSQEETPKTLAGKVATDIAGGLLSAKDLETTRELIENQGTIDLTKLIERIKSRELSKDAKAEGIKAAGREKQWMYDTETGGVRHDYDERHTERSTQRDLVFDTTINVAEGTASVHIPIREKGTPLKAGVTIGSLDLAFGAHEDVFKASNLTDKEKKILEPFVGVTYYQDIEKQKLLQKAAKERIPQYLASKIRRGLVRYNEEKLFNRLGKKGNHKSKEDTIWNTLTDKQQAAILGARIKREDMDFVFTDKKVVDVPSLISLMKAQMKTTGTPFTKVDKDNWNKYINILQEN